MRGKWGKWGLELALILFVVILAYLSFQFQPVATNSPSSSSQQAEVVTSSLSQGIQQTIQVMPGRQTLEAFILENERVPDATEISQIRTATAPETNALMTVIALPSPVP